MTERGRDQEGDADQGREVLAKEAEPEHEQRIGAGQHGAHDAAGAGAGVVAERQGDRALEAGREGGGAAAVGQAVGQQRHGDAGGDAADAEHGPEADQAEGGPPRPIASTTAAEQDRLGELDQADRDVGHDQHREHAALVAQQAERTAVGAQQAPRSRPRPAVVISSPPRLRPPAAGPRPPPGRRSRPRRRQRARPSSRSPRSR